MLARPYILLRDTDQTVLRERLNAILAEWAAAWFSSAGDCVLEDLCVIDSADKMAGLVVETARYCAGQSESGDIAFVGTADQHRLVAALLGIPDHPPSELTALEQQLCARAITDFCRRLVDGFDQPAGPAEQSELADIMSSWLAPGASGATCKAVVAGIGLSLILSPGVVRLQADRISASDIASGGALEDRADVIRSITDSYMRATARLGQVELTVDELASLNVGDVICLDTATTEPVTLDLEGIGRSLHASLGTVAGQPAQQIRGSAEANRKNQMDGSR